MAKQIDTGAAAHENSAHQGVCPHCGYCPHCGRSNAQPYRPVPYPVYPYPVVPWQPYRPVWIARPQTWTNASPSLPGMTGTFSASTSAPALAD